MNYDDAEHSIFDDLDDEGSEEDEDSDDSDDARRKARIRGAVYKKGAKPVQVSALSCFIRLNTHFPPSTTFVPHKLNHQERCSVISEYLPQLRFFQAG